MLEAVRSSDLHAAEVHPVAKLYKKQLKQLFGGGVGWGVPLESLQVPSESASTVGHMVASPQLRVR